MLKPHHQLTKLQRATFFACVAGAAADRGEDKEVYRKRIMREVLGVEHLADVSRTDGYDRLMCRIFEDRGDYARAVDFVGGATKRLRHLCMAAASKIVAQRQGFPDEPADGPLGQRIVTRYIAGVMVQMRFSRETVDSLAIRLQRDDGWDDFTDRQLKAVVAALNAHIRRR